MKKKRAVTVALVLALTFILVSSGCMPDNAVDFDDDRHINVISREDGSGTRGAFVELFGIVWYGENGTKKDLTTKEAVISKQTDVMLWNIKSDAYAIGYISLGSLNSTVKALQIDGIAATSEHVMSGAYPVTRPFLIVTRNDVSDVAQDFIRFILSAEGQGIVSQQYIAVNPDGDHYQSTVTSGKIVIAGSSSVTPVMEKLKEAYTVLNPGMILEIQQSDSSAGMSALADGACDIGMSSRELKASEAERLTSAQIAIDGIAVIVNNKNPANALTKKQVNAIFTGKALRWCDTAGFGDTEKWGLK